MHCLYSNRHLSPTFNGDGCWEKSSFSIKEGSVSDSGEEMNLYFLQTGLMKHKPMFLLLQLFIYLSRKSIDGKIFKERNTHVSETSKMVFPTVFCCSACTTLLLMSTILL